MAHDVYIGYAPRDKTTANAVRAVLESQGLTCWIAARDLPAGAAAAEASVNAINMARVFVLIFSANTNAAEEQVVREVGAATERAIPVIGFRTADVAPSDTLKHFLKTHWIDAFVPPLDTHMRELSDLILGLLGRRGGLVPTLKAIVPVAAPALKGAAALVKNLPVKLPPMPAKLSNLPMKVDLKGLPIPEIDHQAILSRLRLPLLAVLGVLLVAGLGYAGWTFLRPHATPQDTQAWQVASGTDSVPAYQTYLRQFPKGFYLEQANTKLTTWKTETEAAFAKAKAAGTAAAYRGFLDSYSRQGLDVAEAKAGFAAADAREKAEHDAFAAASRTRTRAGYQAFLTQYGAGSDAAEAQRRIAACRSQTRTVTDYQERTLERSATGSATTEMAACSTARRQATSGIQTLCSQGRLGGIRVVNEEPENDPSAGSRRAVGSLLGSIFNRSGRSMDLGGHTYRCTSEVAATCRKPVTATRQVDICP